MAEQFANRAESTLASGISVGATSLAVQAGHGARFPASGDFSILLQDAADETVYELVKCTARATDTLTITATANAWDAADKVVQVLDKRAMEALRDAVASIIDAAGDLLVGSADNTLARLAKGTALQVLRVNAGATALEWATPSSTPTFVGARVKRTSAQTISNNTETAVLWPSETFDTDAIHDTGSNTSRLTVPAGKGGKWRLTTGIRFDDAGSDVSNPSIGYKVNGGTYVRLYYADDSTIRPMETVSDVVSLSASDYVEVVVHHFTGSSRDLHATDCFAVFEYLGS